VGPYGTHETYEKCLQNILEKPLGTNHLIDIKVDGKVIQQHEPGYA
jgi:hypothetical protein